MTRTYKAVEDGVTAVQSANTTRWNSDLACARTVVSNKKAIKDAYDALDLPRPLTESQFADLGFLVKYMEPYDEMTVRLQSKKFPTAGIAMFLLMRLLTNENNPDLAIEKFPQQIHNLHSSIVSFTKSRFPKVSDKVLLAAFADFRLCSFQWLDAENRERAMKSVKAYLIGQKDRYVDAIWKPHVQSGGKTCEKFLALRLLQQKFCCCCIHCKSQSLFDFCCIHCK